MQKYLFQSVLLLGVIGGLSSCREIIPETYYDFDALPVVNAYLIDGQVLNVNVSMSDTLDDKQLTFLDNARIELYVNGDYIEDLYYVENGEYKSATVVKSPNQYMCKVIVPDFDTIFCEQKVPERPTLVDITHINIAGKDEEGASFPAIEVSFKNNTAQNSYYQVVINYIKKNYTSEANLKLITDPVLLIEGIPYAIFSNELIEDSVYIMHINYWTNEITRIGNGPRVTRLYPFYVEFRHVSEDYYRYIKQLYLYKDGFSADGILTSMTNNNIFSNAENGYGIFGAYSSIFSDTITPNTDDYYGY
ncbi:MAG: DUF4249 family protein [Prolixibacteraceae bacterium]